MPPDPGGPTAAAAPDAAVLPVDLRTDDASGLVISARAAPALHWRLEARRPAVRQIAYELQRSALADFGGAVLSSGRIERDCGIGADWPGPPLASREVAWLRVRVWTDRGLTAWSAPVRLEGGLYDPQDWLARPISPVGNRDQDQPRPVPLLRREFALTRPVERAVLYVSALGIHQTWLNGQPVSTDLFDPGWTEYDHRLLYSAYDVTAWLQPGANVMAAAVGDGWWRGNLTWIPRRAVYGRTTALLAQLEITFNDGSREVIASDDRWQGGTGSLRRADFYDGCEIDLAAEPVGWREAGADLPEWGGVVVLPPPQRIEQRAFPAVRELFSQPVMAASAGPGLVRVDCGQNLTGHLRLTVEAAAPATITVRHAEVLEADGALHTVALRTARATDTYHVPAGRHVLSPVFTFHGFRHAEVACDGPITVEQIEAVVVASDLPEIGRFACSDERLNRLASNIRWSQRGNFLAIPTDCPQRDERLGWTGDIQVFAETACTQFDSEAFLRSWLVDLGLAQFADGRVTSVVPNVIQGHDYEYGGIGWGDAATLVPWAIFEAYGDREVLARQFDSMCRWVDWGLSRRDAAGVWTGDFHLGDWLDPGAPPGHPERATTDRDFIASAYLAHSAGTLAQAARALGRNAAADRYAQLSRDVASATWARWHDTLVKTQTGCALAIEFGIAPEGEREAVGARLAALVTAGEGRIATGFLGTPLVLPALTRTGQHEAAFQLLLNEEAPGWLYQVKHGATTMWERWDAILPDGSINSGDMAIEDAANMISFNHYAYGAVGAWLYRSLAGIAPDPADPGYGLIHFAPLPGGGLDWAEAEVRTRRGPATIRWERMSDRLHVALTVPPTARGRFRAPPGWSLPGQSSVVALDSGQHSFDLVHQP
ncbi:alpha-L-rhamnosidase [Novosphingobium sp.]|uniref:alpha-L-rhamnosidase n=1 Tax=Novosphingobium sp. TaxID=1874826 RepID=UPI002626ED8C|nr:alpha-L-rhamnosidase [Novosphingobium sp.]